MEKIPITLLTGFLGSGKTTLLNALLKMPELAHSAVLINEFGEIALDHHFIEVATDNMLVLDNGCICCTVRGELSSALRTLFWQRHDKKIPDFRRVIIETTGLADPLPIIHELLEHPTILGHYCLAGVITCVDGVFGSDQLDRQSESLRQAAVADRLLITKSDLAAAGQMPNLTARLHALNPAAEIHFFAQGNVDPQWVLDTATYDPFGKITDVQKWLKAETYRQVRVKPGLGLNRKAVLLANDINRHDEHIHAFCVSFEQPVAWLGLMSALEMLCTLRGENLLRVKGIVNVEGEDKPRVIHGVQHLFFPTTTLERWPEDKHETQLVFIVRDMDSQFIAQTLSNFVGVAKGTLDARVVH